MTKRLWILSLGLATGCLALVLAAPAAEKPKPEKDPDEVAAENAATVSLALRLAAEGREHQVPEDLLLAARLLRTIPPRKGPAPLKDADISTESDEGKSSASTEKFKAVSFRGEADDLIAEARQMARDDKTLTDEQRKEVEVLAKRVQDPKVGTRGAEGGPQFVSLNIKPGWRDYWKIPFKGNRRAVITVSNDKNQVLHVRVANNDNNTVAEETGPYVNLVWYPEATKQFTIHVTHKGGKPCIFKIVTN